MKKIAIASLLVVFALAVRLEAQETPPAQAQPAAEGAAAVGKVKKPKGKAKAKAKKKSKKGEDYESSKYKAVVTPEPTHYRFDAAGNPILPPAPKKKGKKKKGAATGEEDAEKASDENPSSDCEGDACKSE